MPVSMIKEVLEPELCRQQFGLKGEPWLYRYKHPQHPWQFNLSTFGQPQSGSLSLGGFRIVPAKRAARPDFDMDKEAMGLARGMEGKVLWSRLLKVGGPLGSQEVHRIVGGKCVLLPTADARMGQPKDFELLDFAIACLKDFEATTGIHITTGQDLGHSVMSDGKTHSLEYLNKSFPGSIRANTSAPTAEGNFALLCGMLKGLELDFSQVHVGLIGCGNIGSRVLHNLHEKGIKVSAVEAYAPKREALSAELGIDIFAPEDLRDFFAQPLDVVVVNANGGSLKTENVDAICANPRIKVVCGCENLAMPDKSNIKKLTGSKILFAPTQLCGMFGYLAAVEEYLCAKAGQNFDINVLIEAASALEAVGLRGARHVVENHFNKNLEEALHELY